MEQTLPQAQPELMTTRITVPVEVWLRFKSKAVANGRTVIDALPEALDQWTESQQQPTNKAKTNE